MEKAPKSYQFMEEVIKKQPPDWKKFVIRAAVLLASAMVFGGVAALTFAFFEPRLEKRFAVKEEITQVDIPRDEDPEGGDGSAAVTASSESEDDEEGENTGETGNTNAGESGENHSGEDGTQKNASGDGTGSGSAAEIQSGNNLPAAAGITLQDYEQLYQDMLEVAGTPQRSLVTVIGITNQMDYFNQNYENQSQISGLIVAENGQELFILTEYRVVENVERIQVTFWDSTMVDAIYQKHDSNTGLTILKVEEAKLSEDTLEGLVIAPLGNSYEVAQGDPILALGSPIGYSDSIACGIVTSVTNKISTLDTEYLLLTTDILGSTDGSGVLVNLEGKIVGVIAQGYNTQGNNTITGIAISQVKQLIEGLSNNVTWPYMGIKGRDVTEEISDKTGIPKGVLVTTVAADSPAMMSGLKEYDVIVKLDGEKVLTLRQYHDQLMKKTPGKPVEVAAMRKGAEGYVEVTFEVVIGEK